MGHAKKRAQSIPRKNTGPTKLKAVPMLNLCATPSSECPAMKQCIASRESKNSLISRPVTGGSLKKSSMKHRALQSWTNHMPQTHTSFDLECAYKSGVEMRRERKGRKVKERIWNLDLKGFEGV